MKPRRLPLAWRLYAIGLVQLALLAFVFVGVGRFVRGVPPPPTELAAPHHRGGPRLLEPVETIFLAGIVILGVGSLLTARWIVRPLQDLARVAKSIGAGDLRARSGVRRADEVGDLARAVDEMGGQLEKLVLAEKELLANVSHELRTPLARLRVALDIAGEADAETGRASMTDMSVDLAELESLVNDILTTTRLELAQGSPAAAHFDLHFATVDPGALAERAAERFRARHPTRPLVVELARESAALEADAVLLRRVLDNLLENADKYSPDPTTKVTLRVSRASGGVTFDVEDHGAGIPAEDVPHLFTPFFRGDASRARGTGGVGLGLTLVKRIVEAHGGEVSVTSTPGTGTLFRVLVPIARHP